MILLWLMSVGCKEAGDESYCDSICKELVVECAYEAYPDFASCQQGCAFEADKGESMEPQLECLRAAECDTFGIVACENRSW